ncbi:HAD family hydrolase [Sulfuritalea hydrogenivorans]|jgi:phosphoglycolate phosphatase|uniref:Phosphoglycolate phosphatase n=1 Tax=Sulfuritalea hydrogenivorans sk43H TaxID=1223802 RepID=W0SGB6_9PROT|nr:HAD-IA family hydrolase [Sulfuritalea hydrogenivorans]MDK9712495.1 HAD-IA family hydrolase [Sulfuritalea sp.]BAO29790.1 phosphoglycolate phosphatase [Sulfuritalea hydrogenivorans sk43H]
MPEAVLFDLDGTLADTAPDLGGALNQLLLEQGRGPLPMEQLRPHVSSGARGMIGAGLGITPADPAYMALQQRFLAIYQEALCVGTRLFEGMAEHLDELETQGIPWGIVTNKSQRFAIPLMEGLGLRQRSLCIVCGDSAQRSKPHAHPMQLASAVIGIAAADCIYVGDDERDVISGRAVGMRTVVAAWGYLGDGKPPAAWGADAIAASPQDILGIAAANR